MMQQKTSAFLMGKTTQISFALKEQVIKENNSFLQQQERYRAQKISENIKQRYNQKRRTQD